MTKKKAKTEYERRIELLQDTGMSKTEAKKEAKKSYREFTDTLRRRRGGGRSSILYV